MENWIPVTERLPKHEEEVLAFCRTSYGYEYQCCAIYTPNNMLRKDSCYFWNDVACGEYSEEDDAYCLKEGWYERLYNYDDYDCMRIDGLVTHWMPFPEPPEVER